GGAADITRFQQQRPRRWRGWQPMSAHLAIAPIIVPLCIAALQLLLGRRRRQLRFALSLLSCLLLVAIAAALMLTVVGGNGSAHTIVYNPGNWPNRFAIVLVVDRLAALMLLLTALLSLAVMPYTLGRWRRMGVFF